MSVRIEDKTCKLMNVFVLNTGKCGSTTFTMACTHITNYTASHESRCGIVGKAHLEYPSYHIEVDNRLSWFLGRLDKAYGDQAFYVHLRRDNVAVAKSLMKHFGGGIMKAYKETILSGVPEVEASNLFDISLDFCDTVNSNIELFLRNKSNWMNFSLENSVKDFPEFWHRIGAQGDLDAALAEFDITYNSSKYPKGSGLSLITKGFLKTYRIGKKLPEFIKFA